MPDFVRASLARLGVPGYRVFRWERALAHRRPAVPRSARVPACVGRDLGHARHRADDRLVGARGRGRAAQGRRSAAGRSGSPAALTSPTAPYDDRGARRAARSALRVGVGSAAAADSGRRSAGAIASTSRRRSATTTGRTGCRGRSIASTSSPRRAKRKARAARAGLRRITITRLIGSNRGIEKTESTMTIPDD